MKEIGGYFELESFTGREYHHELLPLNSARNALQYLMKAKKIQKLYIPFYLCDSVSNMLLENDYNFEYYNVNADFTPDFNKELENDEYLYVVNYFGQLTNDVIIALRQRFGRIILDNVQAFFQKPMHGIDTLYSCRKYFGVPDGAYLSTVNKLGDTLENDVSRDRMTHILGRFEGEASGYYQDYLKMDEVFDGQSLMHMSKLTHNLLRAIDYEKVRSTRNENFQFLVQELGAENQLELNVPEGPFAYPFYMENGIEIRKELAKKKIYIPTLWPNILATEHEDSMAYQYSANILPLPCDQRYGIEDMRYMTGILLKYSVDMMGNR